MSLSPLYCEIDTELKKRFKLMCFKKGISIKGEVARLIESEVESFELTPPNEKEVG